MRRFDKHDWMTFGGAETLPSGEPLIGYGTLPMADGTNAVEYGTCVVVSSSEDVFVTQVVGESPGGSFEFSRIWEFSCERDAVCFAEMVLSNNISLQGLDGLRRSETTPVGGRVPA